MYVIDAKTIIEFGDIEIENQTFYQHKIPTVMKNIDINKIVVYNKVSFGKNISLATKMLKNGSLCIVLSKMRRRRDFDKTNICCF